MPFSHIYQPGRLGLSFELFPPKTETAEAELFRHLAELEPFQPDFITCTYGAGGSTQDKTLDIITRVKRQFNRAVASHLTCVGATLEELLVYLRRAQAEGVDYIVALRGDPPRGQSAFQAVDGGLRYASELVALIRRELPAFGIAVAGYPETHQEALSPAADLENLRRKVDAGGDIVITQLFYHNADFFRFRERCAAIGIRAPIVPGILPVTNFAQVQRIASLCGAKLPSGFAADLAAQGDDLEAQFQIGVAFAAAQVEELIREGVPGIHFYVLNKSPATATVLRSVGLRR